MITLLFRLVPHLGTSTSPLPIVVTSGSAEPARARVCARLTHRLIVRLPTYLWIYKQYFVIELDNKSLCEYKLVLF